MSIKTKIIISVVLVTLGVVCRLLPHLWNFAPVAAIALFAGAYLGKKYALFLPVLTMLAGDIFIGFYELKLMLAVYVSFALIGLIGLLLRKKRTAESVIICSLSASILFFLITNFAVWIFSSWYSHTFSGLINCFVMALPFFRNTLMGDLFYVGVLFGAYEFVLFWQTKQSLQAVKIKS